MAEAVEKKNGQVEEKKAVKKVKNKNKRKISRGRFYIRSSYNNTLVTVTDLNGNALAWASAGHLGFKGPKKSTPYAATTIVRKVIDRVRETGLSDADVFVKGIGGGREAAIRAIGNAGININVIKDVTPLPHNGCRPKKTRRV